MISEKELLEAIAECEQDPITSNKIGKLADLYIVHSTLFGEKFNMTKEREIERVVNTNCNSDFLELVNGLQSEKVWAIIDELIEAVKTLHPRMYDRIVKRLSDID